LGTHQANSGKNAVMSTGNHHGALAAVVVVIAATASAPPLRADDAAVLTGLVDAAAQRLQVADPVAAVKWHRHLAVEDPARVQQQLGALAWEADAAGVDSGYITTVFTDQINATESVEYNRFAQWKLEPGSVPAAPPDLSASRAAIDGLNHTMITEFARRRDVLSSPVCAGELDSARSAVTGARGLDSTYQQALWFATRSYCRTAGEG
jgi:chorismate mutase